MQEPSIDTDKLSYEIFSILESKFLFGYDDQKLWVPKQISPATIEGKPEPQNPSVLTENNGNGLSAIKNQRGKICILSVDGGGSLKGIISGKALAYLENALKVKSGDPDARVADYFDVAAGTGIGGIFTAMLFGTKDHNRPILKAEETWRFLADQGKKFLTSGNINGGFLKRFFKGSSTGSTAATAGLEKAMKETFTEKGRNLTLKDTLKPVLIPCYDLSSTAPFLFSRADALETDSFDFRLWEVCRATSAEPGLFDPVLMLSVDGQTRCLAVDGGLAMSNPTAAAITHVLHNKQEFPFVRGVEDLLVLSLGTGQILDVSYDYEQAVAMAFGQCGSSNYVRIQIVVARLGWLHNFSAYLPGLGLMQLNVVFASPGNHKFESSNGSCEPVLVTWSVSGSNMMGVLAFLFSFATRWVSANGSSLGRRCGPDADTDPSPHNVKTMIGIAEEMLKQKNVESVLFGGKRIGEESNSEKLDWFADQLVLEHKRRSCRIAPTVAFKQAATRTA
ncbi:PATATIN-LIKE PROTEIN 6 [Salix koriyanagi]|uniref:Patatin n=1 Tax=Salix koriyanagi TaxID=2511006 RepID=A0A9Q0WIF2_9ROSI|nr:PATATIN-LIKE PROTEIN 6 [Salix koriyanagi]